MSARSVLKHLMSSGSPAQRLEAARALLHDRFRYVALACAWAFGALFLVMSLLGCAHRMPTRSIAQTHESTVAIRATCPVMRGDQVVIQRWSLGSGVVVSPTQVLTAYHVVDEPLCDYSIMYANGTEVDMEIEKVWAANDVARLRTVSGMLPATFLPMSYTEVPAPGSRVCVVAAIPTWGRRCGDVGYYRSRPPGDIAHTGIVEPGNSGSGVYDTQGLLVGITTHLMRCTNGQICGGRFSSLLPEFFE
jgi:S1-C subfamily serine protease